MLKDTIFEQGRLGKIASEKLRNYTVLQRNKALKEMAASLRRQQNVILMENKKDMEEGRKNGLTRSLLDRLMLTGARIEAMADGLENLILLEDPIGSVKKSWKRPNGLEIGIMTVPLGLVGMIYEARPNVTVEAAGLCVKTGNAVLLKGSSTAYYSNKAIAQILNLAALHAGLPENSIQLIDTMEREAVDVMMEMNDYLDVLIPRGGAGLIQNVVKNSRVPVIETGVGNCHAYVDSKADLEMALNIVVNGKVQRPSVCNALETVLVHKEIAEKYLPLLELAFLENNVEVHGDSESLPYFKGGKEVTEEDYYKEYSDYAIAIKVVESIDEAIAHIAKYGTHHSEVIITDSYENARKFQKEVDSACVYVNASTRFSDGEVFGFGAEIGISTQKLHARGPMGLEALTTVKYIINGDGQIR